MANKNNQVHMSRFKNQCFIGLNKVSFHTADGEVLIGDNWLELTDEQSRRNMMVAFFAPRDLNGEPMDPSTVLFSNDDDEMNTDILQQMKSISIFDMCRVEKAVPNVVHIAVIADVVFHWDSKDNYIMPTSEETLLEDLKNVINDYPRTTKKHVYTDDGSLEKNELGEIELHPFSELPLDENMWINKPTFQEKHGTLLLIAGVLLAALTYGGLTYQEGKIDDINQKTQALSKGNDLYPNYRALLQTVEVLEAQNRYKGLFPFVFKDISLTVADINANVEEIALRTPTPNSVSDVLTTQLKFATEAYPSFDEQEPLAEDILRTSKTLTKIRKLSERSGTQFFSLEGLIPLQQLEAQKQQFIKAQTDNESDPEPQENN